MVRVFFSPNLIVFINDKEYLQKEKMCHCVVWKFILVVARHISFNVKSFCLQLLHKDRMQSKGVSYSVILICSFFFSVLPDHAHKVWAKQEQLIIPVV